MDKIITPYFLLTEVKLRLLVILFVVKLCAHTDVLKQKIIISSKSSQDFHHKSYYRETIKP